MSRFRGAGRTTPPLNSVLFESFPELRSARVKQDKSIEDFFENLDDDFLRRSFSYTNNQGTQYLGTAAVAVPHFFTIKRTIAAKSM